MDCRAFTDFLSRRSEHLDEDIIHSMHPIDDTWIGHVSTSRFPAQDGVEHTFDRFENVFPNLAVCWKDRAVASCVGTPCDPDETKIGIGFTRDSYRLQGVSYATDLFCFDQILSADRAKAQFAHIVRTLRRATTIVNSHRLRTEGFRISKIKWVTTNGLTRLTTATWNANCTELTVSALPTSKMSARHLQRRVSPQIRNGALGESINRGAQPMLEFVSDMESVWDMIEGENNLTDHWRFQDFDNAGNFYKYGWTGKLGNYGLRADPAELRFNLKSTNADGTFTLQLVFPYVNQAATEGIREIVNEDYDNAHYAIQLIWHRRAMTSMVRDTTAINPEMPFAARDFGGRWQFVMDNITCGTDENGNPIAVDNKRRNKGQFIADWEYATMASYPELAESFLTLREPACIVDIPICAAPNGYPTQNYSSANDQCLTGAVVLTFTPVLNQATSRFVIEANSIQCNEDSVFHERIDQPTLSALVAALNGSDDTNTLGTFAVSGSNITLSGTACSSAVIPFTS